MGLRDQRAQALERKQGRKERDVSPAVQWEYLAKNLGMVASVATENEFNKLGRRGWEFVAVADGYAIFKRMVEDADAVQDDAKVE